MLRLGIKTGLVLAVLLALMKLVQSRRNSSGEDWAPASPPTWPPIQDPVAVEPPAPIVTRSTPAPDEPPVVKKTSSAKKGPGPQKAVPAARKAPAAKKAAVKKAPSTRKAAAPAGAVTWVDPIGRICPPSHPVKAKLSSRIFHLPGMAAYNRTTPDRCYPDDAAAASDGFTPAKR